MANKASNLTTPTNIKEKNNEISEPSKTEITPSETISSKDLSKRHKRYGWTALFLFLSFGSLLEGLLGFKSIGLVMDPLRRELWSLAHFHGAMLAIINLVYSHWTENISSSQQNIASWSLIFGSILLPLGFFLGGIAHLEADPSLGIFLVPIGTLMLLYTIFLQVINSWKK
ncbi:MAG: hypothetical protein IPK14_08125 [Blastocatellia bacterium]|nr:hypothetical protein [Blastocatellia bacterium]